MNILLVVLLVLVTWGLVNYYYKLIKNKKNAKKLMIALNEMTKKTIDGLKKMQNIANSKYGYSNKDIMEARLNNKLEYENKIKEINEEALEKLNSLTFNEDYQDAKEQIKEFKSKDEKLNA